MKKLSKSMAIALAAAMTLSAFPANTMTVSAASTPAINGGNKSIFVGKKYTYKVKNSIKGYTNTWTSSNKKVATVSSTGVVKGISPGTANITLKSTSKDKKKSYTSKVRVAIKESAVSIVLNHPDNNSMSVDATFKFVPTIKTKSGGRCTDTKVFKIIPETNTAGATCNKTTGTVSVKQAGSFEIVCYTATSATNYDAGKYTAVSDPIKIDVPLTLDSKMTASNKVVLTSNSPMNGYKQEEFTITNQSINQVQKVNNFELSSDNKTITFTMVNNFEKNGRYKIALEKEGIDTTFTTSYGEISRIEVTDQQIAPNVPTPVQYTIFDANGIDITTLYPFNTPGMNFDFTPSTVKMDSSGRITLPTKNDYAFFKISYTYLDSFNKVKTISNDNGHITAVASTISGVENWTLSTSSNVDWSKTSQTIALGETGRRLYCKFKDSVGGTIDTSRTSFSSMIYSSSDSSILGIDKSTGVVYPYKQGSVTLTITDGNFTEKINISVVAARTPAALAAETTDLVLSSQSGLSDTQTIRINLKDQYGENVKAPTYQYPTARVIAGSNNIVTIANYLVSGTETNATGSMTSGDSFDVVLRGRAVGTATIMIKYAGQTTTINVTVKAPGAVASFMPALSNTTIDSNTPNQSSTILTVYAVDSNGLRINQINEGYYSITKSDGTAVLTNQMMNMDGKNDGDIINATALKLTDGTYTVTITIGPKTASTTFTVKTSSSAVTYVSKQSTINVETTDDLCTKILECLPIYMNGSDITGIVLTSDVKIDYTSYDTSRFPSGVATKGSKNFSQTYSGYSVKLRINKISFSFGGMNYELAPESELFLTTK